MEVCQILALGFDHSDYLGFGSLLRLKSLGIRSLAYAHEFHTIYVAFTNVYQRFEYVGDISTVLRMTY